MKEEKIVDIVKRLEHVLVYDEHTLKPSRGFYISLAFFLLAPLANENETTRIFSIFSELDSIVHVDLDLSATDDDWKFQ